MGTTFRAAKLQDAKGGEIYMYDATNVITINQSNQCHAVTGFTSGNLLGFTHVTGLTGSGNITTAGGGAAINIADVAHGLVTGDIVTVQSANHDATAVVTKIDADNFTVPISFVGNEAGTWQMGDYLLAGANTAGEYRFIFSISGLTSGANVTFKWELNYNTTVIESIVAERKHSSTDIGNMGSSGAVAISVGDRIWMSCKNKTDSTNFTIEHCNVNGNRQA